MEKVKAIVIISVLVLAFGAIAYLNFKNGPKFNEPPANEPAFPAIESASRDSE